MPMADVEAYAADLRTRMADQLLRGGAVGTGLHRVFARVPRHAFVPTVYRPRRSTDGTSKTEQLDATDPVPWLETVYSDRAVLIQPAGGHSSTAPSLMGRMLQALAAVPGDRVLEIGTCTGYNTAVLCELLSATETGQGELVTSIDLHEDWADAARERLATASYEPTVAAYDGAHGYPGNAPYDRILSTCAVDHIPAAWLEQLRPGGRIITPIAGGIARITHHGDGTARGRFLPFPAHFMSMHTGPQEQAGLLRTTRAAHTADPDTTRTSTLTPETYDHIDAAFMLRLASPGLARARRGETLILWHADGSWARVGEDTVHQAGPRRLWDEIETTYTTWNDTHRPGRDRYGITVTPQAQHIWLDHPDSGVTWSLTDVP